GGDLLVFTLAAPERTMVEGEDVVVTGEIRPFLLVALFLGHPQWKWVAIGSALGVASCLAVSAVMSPSVLWLGSGIGARLFLMANALLCFGLAYFASKEEGRFA
ncbi:MAG: DUF5942 domain-containing protein, partial [Coleofasciculus sp. C2-GNP5-27]